MAIEPSPPERDGSGSPVTPHVSITAQPLCLSAMYEAVADPAAGAIVVFEGVTREVPRLEYEAYVAMAEERIAAIVGECIRAHGLQRAAVAHRVGEVTLGEPSVIVAVSAAHREQAFAGARDAIDRIKAEAPIWKRELPDGEAARWVAGAEPPGGQAPSLTHLGEDGRARMVDVSAKRASRRIARARARLRMTPRAARAVHEGNGPKGEVLGAARVAGIQAAKQTAQLIPLAHPLALTFIDVKASVDLEAGTVELEAEAATVAPTGVEMEAMTACATAALTVYDMVKGLEPGIEIEQVVLLEKHGGRSDYRRGEG